MRDATTRAPRDPYVFSGSTVAGGASGSTARTPSGQRKSSLGPASQAPRSALKGGRARAAADYAEADRFEDEPVVEVEMEMGDVTPPDDYDVPDYDDEPPAPYDNRAEPLFRRPSAAAAARAADRSVTFTQPARSSASSSVKGKGKAPASASTSKQGRQSTLTNLVGATRSPLSSAAVRNEQRRKSTNRQASPPRAASSSKSAASREKQKEKERRAREAQKARDKERAEAKRAAQEINERNRKRKRGRAGDDDEEDDEEEEYEVEFEDEDGEGGPDVTMQEDVIVGNRVAKDARRTNGQTAKLMRKRLRRAIRLALEDDPEDVQTDDVAGDSSSHILKKRKISRGGTAQKLTDADVIWSVVDAELKTASQSQASNIASSTLKELRKIVRTLFEGLSIKASERRELIAQLERARRRKKHLRKEVFDTRRLVLKNEEEIERIRRQGRESVQKAQVSSGCPSCAWVLPFFYRCS